jgi:hypothetical protein
VEKASRADLREIDEDPANSVGYETAEGGYQLATTDTWDLLDELGLGHDLSAPGLHADLTNALGMSEWVHRGPYSLTEEQARRTGWDEFSDLVKHRVRYLMFSPKSKPTAEGIKVTDPDDIGMLETTSAEIELLPKDEVTDPSDMLDELGALFKKYDLFYTIPAGTLLYRVRIHSPEQRPDNTVAALGPPRAEHARFSNRMSPAGVPMFYAAFDEATAIAETSVRHDGKPAERTMATFRVVKESIVLDLVDLPAVPSIFDSDEANWDRPALSFLTEFVEDLTRPIEKDGREHVDYVPSQIVTEYVRYRLSAKVGHALFGIRYRSARHAEGIGCVLFLGGEDLDDGPFSEPKASHLNFSRTRPRRSRLRRALSSNPETSRAPSQASVFRPSTHEPVLAVVELDDDRRKERDGALVLRKDVESALRVPLSSRGV